MMYVEAKVWKLNTHTPQYSVSLAKVLIANDGRGCDRSGKDTKKVKIRNQACLSEHLHRVVASFPCNHEL